MVTVSYNDVEQLRAVLERVGHHVAAFIVEPIQGEAGFVFPFFFLDGMSNCLYLLGFFFV